jgi:trehalose 6-phosphate synthase/phosphatase
MTKTIIVSNRLPIEFKITANRIETKPSIGGLATGLKSIHEQSESIWVGWSGLTEEQLNAAQSAQVIQQAQKLRCVTVALTEKDVRQFYFGFSNRALWPLFHYFTEYTEYYAEQWEAYRRVNEKFADKVLEIANPGDTVWIHDYQLLLLPQMLRERNKNLQIGFFLHIPFPSFEIIRACPWRNELLTGMLGADLIGFHTYDYVQHFLNSVRRIAHLPVKFNEIAIEGRYAKADSFPMGIDYQNFHQAALNHHNNQTEESELLQRLREHAVNYPDSKLILSIDRMDYTKGIPGRIRAFEHFLEKYPQYLEKVRLVMLAVPSRSNVPQYGKLKKETDELVGRVNGKFSTIDWTPIWYFYRSMPFDDLVNLYAFSHVALITPLRDGMNLVAKEYVATRTNADGVLILSEMAGAASEMQEALLINPNNADQVATALHQALQMPDSEQKSRMMALQKRLSRYTVERWAQDFMKGLQDARQPIVALSGKKITPKISDNLYESYISSENRLVLLDYDGTLVDFCNNPKDACPDNALYDLLDKIEADSNTELAIISGRGRDSIEPWFADKPYTLVTDHGVWLRRSGQWQQLEDPKTEWKEIIRPILENFVDRTPGTFIEEKDYSLAWHYRRAEHDLAEARTRELKILLTGLVAENGLSVLDGDKVVEVKNSAVSKGRAAAILTAGRNPDYIFAAGDDFTDEYMFEGLPENAHTVKVGTAETKARYYAANSRELKDLLQRFAEIR